MEKRVHNDGSPLIFCVSFSEENGDIVVANLSSENYFRRKRAMCDSIRLPRDIKNDWDELGESMFEWINKDKTNMAKAHQSMIDNGFTFSREFAEFIKDDTGEEVWIP